MIVHFNSTYIIYVHTLVMAYLPLFHYNWLNFGKVKAMSYRVEEYRCYYYYYYYYGGCYGYLYSIFTVQTKCKTNEINCKYVLCAVRYYTFMFGPTISARSYTAWRFYGTPLDTGDEMPFSCEYHSQLEMYAYIVSGPHAKCFDNYISVMWRFVNFGV